MIQSRCYLLRRGLIAAGFGIGFSSSINNLPTSQTARTTSARPIIAIVAPAESPILKAMPSALRERCQLIHVGETEAAMDAQADELCKAVALLWLPAGGKPSQAPSETLAALWPRLPRCKWVHSFATGVDGLRPFITGSLLPDKDRVVLTNGRGAFSESLAEHALAGMLHFNKQLSRCEENRRKGNWDCFTMDTMSGKTVGLVGYGSIGKSAGRSVKAAFGSRVIALRRQPQRGGGDDVADEVFGPEDRLAFLGKCDFVVCSLPGTDATLNFFGPEEFAAMKPGCVFLSLGRGAAVDEEALAAALAPAKVGDAAHLKGAVLDVFKVEPLPTSSPLWSLPNVLLTAHNADFTSDYFELGWKVCGGNLEAFTSVHPEGSNKNLATPVDMQQGY